MNVEEDISIMNNIIEKAKQNTPYHIKGLLIPENLLCDFFLILDRLIYKAKYYKKYHQYIMESSQKSQKAVDDFVLSLSNAVKEGRIKFVSEEEQNENMSKT